MSQPLSKRAITVTVTMSQQRRWATSEPLSKRAVTVTVTTALTVTENVPVGLQFPCDGPVVLQSAV